MTTSILRPLRIPILLTMLGVGAAYISATALWHIGVAHADPVVVVPPAGDPIVIANQAAGEGWDLVAQYGPIWGAALILFGSIGAFLRSNKSKGWLAQGRVLALLTGGAMTLGALLDWHFHGAPIAGVLVTAIMAIKLVWSPAVTTPLTGPVLDAAAGTAPADTTITSRLADRGFGLGPGPGPGGGAPLLALLALGLGLGFASQLGCDSWRRRAAAGATAFLNCEAPNVDPGLLAEAKGVAISAVGKWIDGSGHVDTAGLRSEAEPLKSDLMRCAFDGAIAALATPAPKNPSAPLAAGLEVDGADLRAKAAMIRAELGWPAAKAPGS